MRLFRFSSVAAVLAILLASVPIAAAKAQNSRVRLVGIVSDERAIVVANVDISLVRNDKIELATRSGDQGQFEFRDVTPGKVLLVAHRLGYKERSLAVDVGSSAQQTVQIDLVTLPKDIETVVVEDSPGRLQEFIEHRKASKFGHFFDQNQIRVKNPRYLSELFRTIPGARLAPSPSGGSKLLLRGCKPKIWLDGVLAQDAEIDELIGPSEIAGIEIYTSMAGVPAQYMDRENRACGAVIIWSRQS